MARAQTASAGFGHAPSLGPICSMLASFSGRLCSHSGQMAQSSSRQSSSQLQVQTKKSLFSNYLQLGPIAQAWNTGFHQNQEWGQPLSHSEWLLKDNHSATTRRRGDARWAQVWQRLDWVRLPGMRNVAQPPIFWILIMFYLKKLLWILLHNLYFYVQVFLITSGLVLIFQEATPFKTPWLQSPRPFLCSRNSSLRGTTLCNYQIIM